MNILCPLTRSKGCESNRRVCIFPAGLPWSVQSMIYPYVGTDLRRCIQKLSVSRPIGRQRSQQRWNTIFTKCRHILSLVNRNRLNPPKMAIPAPLPLSWGLGFCPRSPASPLRMRSPRDNGANGYVINVCMELEGGRASTAFCWFWSVSEVVGADGVGPGVRS